MRPSGVLRLMAFVLGMTCASAATAQSILAGEHADFTRIAVRSAGGQDPKLRVQDAAIRVQGIVGVRSGDLADAIQKLAKTRVRGIKVNPDGIEIALNCDCEAETFDYRGYLVIDISEPKSEDFVSLETRANEAFDDWKIPQSSIAASCSIGAWCEDLMSIELGLDTDDYCAFAPGVLVNLTQLKGSDHPQAERLRHYIDKGWQDEAALLIGELKKTDPETSLLKWETAPEMPECEGTQAQLEWVMNTPAEPAWEPTPKEAPFEEEPREVAQTTPPQPAEPREIHVENTGDVHSRALSLLQSYKAVLE